GDDLLVRAGNGERHLRDRSPFGAERNARLPRRGVDAEDDHDASLHDDVSPSKRSHRSAHAPPRPVRTTSRPSSSGRVHSSTSRYASGNRPSITSPHSTNVTPSGSSSSSNPKSMTSWIRSRRYTSTWLTGRDPRYRRTSVNVGDATGSVTPRAFAAPFTNVVLPAPRSPVSTTTSPPDRTPATAAPSSCMASTVGTTSSRTAGTTAPEVPSSEQVELLLERLGPVGERL